MGYFDGSRQQYLFWSLPSDYCPSLVKIISSTLPDESFFTWSDWVQETSPGGGSGRHRKQRELRHLLNWSFKGNATEEKEPIQKRKNMQLIMLGLI